MLTEVVALEQAVDLISEAYFDGHDVLFTDSRKKLMSSFETVWLLISGYNQFAQDNRIEPINIEAIQRTPGSKVDSFVKEWVALSRSQHFVARFTLNLPVTFGNGT